MEDAPGVRAHAIALRRERICVKILRETDRFVESPGGRVAHA
jgi:hypothetical protein